MEKLSYKSLSPHVRMLQVSGILPLARDAPPWKYRLHQAYTALMTVIPYLYALQNLGHMYKVTCGLCKLSLYRQEMIKRYWKFLTAMPKIESSESPYLYRSYICQPLLFSNFMHERRKSLPE